MPPKKSEKVKWMTPKEAKTLVIESERAIDNALEQLNKVRPLAAKAGFTVDCNSLPRNVVTPTSSQVAALDETTATTATVWAVDPRRSSTGGFSNTDHSIVRTGDAQTDRINDLKRNIWRRHRAMQPESRSEDRWDKKQRVPGERRRRIVRDVDAEGAPHEPGVSGYVLFLAQMTLKIRHDRPNQPHDQTKVMSEVSKLWSNGMSEDERKDYTDFSDQAREVYLRQLIEYRATGKYTPSTEFIKLPQTNVWIRRNGNLLEQEIQNYPTYTFPKRPPSMDKAYEEREERSRLKRKLKSKGLMNEDGTFAEGVDFDELLQQERLRRQKISEAASESKAKANEGHPETTTTELEETEPTKEQGPPKSEEDDDD
eukprot:Nitzschia sp. Nitz4//scaffold135_size62275//34535//35644//NITZ4_006353-RA/size62275-processed-gene-0.33-mRNA-1//-1//CDS//3329535572//6952//frame0